MNICDLRSETALLARLLTPPMDDGDLLVPNGDDGAVILHGHSPVAYTTDAFCEGVHFSFDYFSPFDLGVKVVEATASDVVAMGGRPQNILISLSIKKDSPVSTVEELYDGIHEACARVGARIIGGDLTGSRGGIMLSLTCFGELIDKPATRSGARVGDVVAVTGCLGASHAGLRAFLEGLEGYEYVKERHRRPRCRVDLVEELAPIATSMIDVSDGLGSELRHLGRMSKVGFTIRASEIPMHEETKAVAEKLGESPLSYAFDGGEDFQLLFTALPHTPLPAGCTAIGYVTGEKILIEDGNDVFELQFGGFDHLGTKPSNLETT